MKEETMFSPQHSKVTNIELRREKSRFRSPNQFWEKNQEDNTRAKGEADRKNQGEQKKSSVSVPNPIEMSKKDRVKSGEDKAENLEKEKAEAEKTQKPKLSPKKRSQDDS